MSTPRPDQLPYRVAPHIGGESRAVGTSTYERENPADVREIVSVTAESGVSDVDDAVAAARAVFDGDTASWVDDHALRRRVLIGTAELLRENAENLAQMMCLEIGMPIRMSRPHIAAAAEVFDFYAGYVGKTYGESIQLANGSVIDTLREPVGVVGIIVPWNFPFKQAARKLAPALAVGCTTVVKPSPYTNACTLELVRLMEAAGAPPGVCNLIPGASPEIGSALTAHPGVDKISFTGSTRVGIMVQQSASATVKRVGLELGGKNAAVVFGDADLAAAANGVTYGMFLNSGQACGSVSRLVVEESVHDELVARMVSILAGLRLGSRVTPRHRSGRWCRARRRASSWVFWNGRGTADWRRPSVAASRTDRSSSMGTS
jgi:betaine-aldehyde dehydrogenase